MARRIYHQDRVRSLSVGPNQEIRTNQREMRPSQWYNRKTLSRVHLAEELFTLFFSVLLFLH